MSHFIINRPGVESFKCSLVYTAETMTEYSSVSDLDSDSDLDYSHILFKTVLKGMIGYD